jgi:hypothetical protein
MATGWSAAVTISDCRPSSAAIVLAVGVGDCVFDDCVFEVLLPTQPPATINTEAARTADNTIAVFILLQRQKFFDRELRSVCVTACYVRLHPVSMARRAVEPRHTNARWYRWPNTPRCWPRRTEAISRDAPGELRPVLSAGRRYRHMLPGNRHLISSPTDPRPPPHAIDRPPGQHRLRRNPSKSPSGCQPGPACPG